MEKVSVIFWSKDPGNKKFNIIVPKSEQTLATHLKQLEDYRENEADYENAVWYVFHATRDKLMPETVKQFTETGAGFFNFPFALDLKSSHTKEE
jgi:hypothetical protein